VTPDFDKVKVARADFLHALNEVKPAFGVAEAELQQCVPNGIIKFNSIVDKILGDGQLFVGQVKNSNRTPLVSVLLYGHPGSGKTALATTIAMASDFPFIKLISPDSMVGFTEQAKMSTISKIFSDAYKSPMSCLVIDSIERLLDWVSIGPRFSNSVLQTLLVLLKKPPPKGHKLLLVATTSQKSTLEQMELLDVFNTSTYVPNITSIEGIAEVLKDLGSFDTASQNQVLNSLIAAGISSKISIGVKKLIYLIEMACQDVDKVTTLIDAIRMEGVRV
jgi:vesicle-fusing ATPase